jgi:hypothetical protein
MIDSQRTVQKLLTTFLIECIKTVLPRVVEYIKHETIAFLPQKYFNNATTAVSANEVLHCLLNEAERRAGYKA